MESIADDEMMESTTRASGYSSRSAGSVEERRLPSRASARRTQIEENGKLLHSLANEIRKLADKMGTLDEVPRRLAQVEETFGKTFAVIASGKLFSPQMLAQHIASPWPQLPNIPDLASARGRARTACT